MSVESKYYSAMLNKNSKKQVSSRLVKKEQKELTKQTLITVSVTIGIILLFVFVIMPGAIRLFFKLIDKGSNFDPGDTLAPQVPVLNAPVTATPSAKLKLSGFAEAKSDVVFVLNAQEVDRVKVAGDGQFSYDLALDKGENELTLYSLDAAGNESATTKAYHILMDNEIPSLEIESPADGSQIELKKNQQLTITGKTEAKAKVYVNGRMNYADADGKFTAVLLLNEGENKIEIKAEDKAGNSSQKELKVNFKY